MPVTREDIYDAAFWLAVIILNSTLYSTTENYFVKVLAGFGMVIGMFMLGGLGRYIRNRADLRPRGNSNGRES